MKNTNTYLEELKSGALNGRMIEIYGCDEKKAQDQGLETIMQLAFIMAKQAEKADMAALDDDAFIGWLEGFGPMAFVETAEDILNVYMDSTVSTAEP